MLSCVAVVQAADRFVTFNGKEASFAIAKDGHVLNIVCDAQEDEGVVMALRSLQADLKSVTGHEAQIGQQVQPQCIMVGSMQSALIRQLADKGKIDKKALQGKREKYLLQVVEKPTANVTRALVIAIMPTCEKCNMNICVHPDDPPIEVLGLPRIVRTEEDIQWFLDAVPNKHNGLTFCAGSLSAGAYNNVVELARKFASRTHFVHLRSCHIFPNGDFTEASHLGGRADLIELARIFEKENPNLPMRVDHGMTFTDKPGGIFDESTHGHNAGYTLLGRMFALGQVQGILATVDSELGINYQQPGFFD